MIKKYPKELKREARRLVKLGLTKRDVSRMKKVNYNTLYTWTNDLVRRKGRFGIRGKSLEFLKMLVDRGYILSKEVKQLVTCMRNLRRHLPIKKVKIKKNVVWYLSGREREAMEAMLKNMGRRSLSYQELGRIRMAFGIKNIKGNNKIRERFSK